jgi:hypothetical protein
MKWKDLSLKERKQIYDSVRVNNPGATYFDIKQQFDSIPAYQDGKGKTINKADLPPEYRTGTPVDEKMILEYMRNPTSNKMVKNQYDLYRNKNEYIDRLNKLIPMEILMPLGGAGFAGYELNKE